MHHSKTCTVKTLSVTSLISLFHQKKNITLMMRYKFFEAYASYKKV